MNEMVCFSIFSFSSASLMARYGLEEFLSFITEASCFLSSEIFSQADLQGPSSSHQELGAHRLLLHRGKRLLFCLAA